MKESDVEEDENAACLQENYNSFLEKSGEYARVQGSCKEDEESRGRL